MTDSTCPACTAISRAVPGMQCNHCRKTNPSALSKAMADASREYVANGGPLSAERIAQYDAAARG